MLRSLPARFVVSGSLLIPCALKAVPVTWEVNASIPLFPPITGTFTYDSETGVISAWGIFAGSVVLEEGPASIGGPGVVPEFFTAQPLNGGTLLEFSHTVGSSITPERGNLLLEFGVPLSPATGTLNLLPGSCSPDAGSNSPCSGPGVLLTASGSGLSFSPAGSGGGNGQFSPVLSGQVAPIPEPGFAGCVFLGLFTIVGLRIAKSHSACDLQSDR
jgi:hypothetical protein